MTNKGSSISATNAVDMNELIWKIREGEIKCYTWNENTSSWERLTKGLISVSGQPVKVSGEVVYVSGQPVKVSGQAVRVSGQSVATSVSGNVVQISGQVVKVSGETVTGKISGQTIKTSVSGDVVKVSGQPVEVSGQTIATTIPTSLQNNQTLISGTNLSGATPVQVGSAECVSVTVKALSANSGDVYVGNSNVSSDKGYVLAPGESVAMDINNINNIYATSEVDGDKVCWASVN